MKISKGLKFVCEKSELSGVKKIAKKVAADFKLVFGFEPELVEGDSHKTMEGNDPCVIFGTAATSSYFAEKLGTQNLNILRFRTPHIHHRFLRGIGVGLTRIVIVITAASSQCNLPLRCLLMTYSTPKPAKTDSLKRATSLSLAQSVVT